MQSTLADISSMFQRFSNIVVEQGEMIDRIDIDTEATITDVNEAHTQPLKFQRGIRGSRGLIIKAFCTLFLFMMVFGLLWR